MDETLAMNVIDLKKTRNVILDTTCLVITGEIVSLLAGSNNFSWEVTLFTLAGVILLLLFAMAAVKNPYTSLFSTLIIFIIVSILSAAAKPGFLGGSIVIKIFILIHLIRAIPDAREAQVFLRKQKE